MASCIPATSSRRTLGRSAIRHFPGATVAVSSEPRAEASALMVCMLRSQGIPARLMIGYADKNYHAWTVTSVANKEVFFDPTAALNAISKPVSYSVERYY